MHATDIECPELSLVAWGRTARPVALPDVLQRLAALLSRLMPLSRG